ncbi:MAG: NAD(+) synthase [Deltaproteobacteria bacterium]|nr:NAD(+) synthase [Deltaproteobacteria bacterium]
MRPVKVSVAVLNQTPLDWAGNRRRVEEAVLGARAAGASLVLLPELCLTGYGCEDAFLSRGVLAQAESMLAEVVPLSRGMCLSVGLPVLVGSAVFNAAAVCVDGRLAGLVAKRFLAGDGIHYEPRWFKPWPEGIRQWIELAGARVPIGDLFFEVGGLSMGFEICEDAWVANRPGIRWARRGVDVLLNPSASHFAFGKLEVRMRFVLEGSRAFGMSYLYANLLGNESGRAIYDGGALIASGGKLVARGPRFSFEEVGLTHAVIDVEAGRMTRARLASYSPDLSLEDDKVVVPFAWPSVPAGEISEGPGVTEPWESSPRKKEEELSRSVTLALFDYARKSRSKGFVVSLSGGADSAACACLVALMVKLGVRELGARRFAERFGRPELEEKLAGGLATESVLTCAYQATANSSETTLVSAREIASGIGARFFELDVEPLRASFVSIVEGALGRRLAWSSDDIVLQNIQARVRAPGIWMFANILESLLLATSNRSEAAVGYATMDGDTAGGLSPLGGIDKAFLRRWLEWLEREGPDGLGPIPALARVTRLAPTAELRPPGEAQTDEKDLMPYPVLDAIERAAIRDKLVPLEVLEVVAPRFHEYGRREMAVWVERFFRLFCRNQWKRERYAPSFHLDDENLDPKTWFRFPILSGGFEVELKEMWASLEER